MSLKDFLYVLFDKNDAIWINDKIGGVVESEFIKHLNYDFLNNYCSDEGVFFTIHAAMTNGLTRTGDNSKLQFRNFLIEFDDKTIEEQKEFIKKIKMPFTSAVYSGGKSIHYIISLENPLDYDEYLHYFRYIQELTLCDKQNKCKVRYSRLPYTYRGSEYQELLELKTRVSNDVFLNWLESPEIKKIRLINSYKKRSKKIVRKQHNSEYEPNNLLEWYLHDYLERDFNSDFIHVQCPVCAQDGHDKSCDNLIINSDYSYRCWFDDDHNRRMLPTINKLQNGEDGKKRKGAF